MNKLKNFAMALALAFTGVFGAALISGGEVYAATTCPNGTGTYEHSIAECGVNSVQDPNQPEPDLMTTIKNVINAVLGVVGVLAVIVIIIGGIYFIISQGDSAKITRARNTILYGVVGLIVALLAFAIVNFVLSSVF